MVSRETPAEVVQQRWLDDPFLCKVEIVEDVLLEMIVIQDIADGEWFFLNSLCYLCKA